LKKRSHLSNQGFLSDNSSFENVNFILVLNGGLPGRKDSKMHFNGGDFTYYCLAIWAPALPILTSAPRGYEGLNCRLKIFFDIWLGQRKIC